MVIGKEGDSCWGIFLVTACRTGETKNPTGCRFGGITTSPEFGRHKLLAFREMLDHNLFVKF